MAYYKVPPESWISAEFFYFFTSTLAQIDQRSNRTLFTITPPGVTLTSFPTNYVLEPTTTFTARPVFDAHNLQFVLTHALDRDGYRWPTVQNDTMDSATDFVYQTRTYNGVEIGLNRWLGHEQYADLLLYARARFVNYWHSQATEAMFHQRGAEPNPRANDKRWDFSLDGVQYDLKTSNFPGAKYGRTLGLAKQFPQHLAQWLVANASKERRAHEWNRIFLVLHAADRQHFKLRARFDLIEVAVESFLADPTYYEVTTVGGQVVRAGVIFVES